MKCLNINSWNIFLNLDRNLRFSLVYDNTIKIEIFIFHDILAYFFQIFLYLPSIFVLNDTSKSYNYPLKISLSEVLSS